MTALQVIEKSILIETLLSIPEILPLVDFGGQYKVFWEHVPQGMELPYIVVSQIMGGDDNSAQSRASDSTYKIIATTGDMSQAEAFANAISTLHEKLPVVTRFTSIAAPYTTIEETTPIFDRIQVQNIPVFMIGGLYRLRLSITE
jgi:hypothetical protein